MPTVAGKEWDYWELKLEDVSRKKVIRARKCGRKENTIMRTYFGGSRTQRCELVSDKASVNVKAVITNPLVFPEQYEDSQFVVERIGTI